VHTAGVTTGSVHDAKVRDNLIREDDTAVYGDKGYARDVKKRAAETAGVLWAVKEKAKPGRGLTKRQRARNRHFGKGNRRSTDRTHSKISPRMMVNRRRFQTRLSHRGRCLARRSDWTCYSAIT
jgi:IS5 family transposase